jgi:hypothetical protein
VGVLSQDLRLVQNTALGSFLQWRFSAGYAECRSDAAGAPLALVFLVLPLLLHEPTLTVVTGTTRATGLRGFASKFSSSKLRRSDILLALHERVDRMRELSLHSLRTALAYRLVTVDRDAGSLYPLSRSEARAHVPSGVRPLVKGAEKLGDWFSRLTPFEIALVLKVRF